MTSVYSLIYSLKSTLSSQFIKIFKINIFFLEKIYEKNILLILLWINLVTFCFKSS